MIFDDSTLRYQKILRVTQGGAITYGKSIDSIDPNNAFAGPEFAVGHYIEVHITTDGYYGLFTAVCVISAIFYLVLIRMTWRFTLLREHHLDHRCLQTWFARLLPVINSYEVSFQNLRTELMLRHGHQPDLELPDRGKLSIVLGRYKLDQFTEDHPEDNNEPPPMSEGMVKRRQKFSLLTSSGCYPASKR